jgi:hypothetical protein
MLREQFSRFLLFCLGPLSQKNFKLFGFPIFRLSVPDKIYPRNAALVTITKFGYPVYALFIYGPKHFFGFQIF